MLGQGRNHEALVFLHGFNCCLADACKTLAQFLALAACKDISSLTGSCMRKLAQPCAARRWSVLGQGRNHEALVFLHGFNCCLADACRKLAQFLALLKL